MKRIAVVATHPIQHFCPQYRSLSAHPATDLRVLFWTLKGLAAYEDRDFARVIAWDEGLLADIDWRSSEASDEILRGQLDEFDPDWVIVYGYRTPSARTARAWARQHRRRIAYVSDTEERHAQPRWRRWGRRLRMRMVFRAVDRFLSVGDANEAFYRACGVRDDRSYGCTFPSTHRCSDAPPQQSHAPSDGRGRTRIDGLDGRQADLSQEAGGSH